jgi:hypothetical protein
MGSHVGPDGQHVVPTSWIKVSRRRRACARRERARQGRNVPVRALRGQADGRRDRDHEQDREEGAAVVAPPAA